MITEKILTPDILIAGAGIAGATVAAGLRDRGYSVVQLEASDQPLDTARGDHLGPRVVETLANWNILDAFFDAGAEKRLGARWQMPDGEIVLHSGMDDLPLPYPYYVVLNHDLISETALALAINEPDFDYTLFRPAAAKDIATGPEALGGVTEVRITDGEGRPVLIRPRLTFACDGRSSRIRAACGFEVVKSYDYEKPFVVLFGPRGELQDPRNEIISFLSPNGGVSRIPRMAGQWKIGLAIDKADIARWKASGNDERKALLAERADVLGQMDTEVAGFYPVIRRETGSWVKGTTVLLGDACHTIHPARGQGMNFGIRCAARLFDYLPKPKHLEDAALVAKRLAQYEADVKPMTDEQLDENHARGVMMDGSGADRMNDELPELRAIAADENAHVRYRMTMAGYADRLDPL
jgi:2-polyprenyl-6-methoxyphenol hydroxylase-like FAD-dependent oxidoreductase